MFAEIDLKILGRRISMYRYQKNLTQEKLAELVGISTQAIGNIERGIKAPSITTFFRLTLALHISASDLLDETVIRQPTDSNVWKLHAPQTIFHNTLTDWLCEKEPEYDDSVIVDLRTLPPLGFLALDEDFPDYPFPADRTAG